MRFFFDCIRKFLERYKRLNDFKYEDDQLQAGVQRLEVFGSFGTMINIARNNNMTYKQVSELPAAEVYTMLLLDFETSEYEKRLQEIWRQRNQVKK